MCPFPRGPGVHTQAGNSCMCVCGGTGRGPGSGVWPGLRCGPPTDGRAEAPPRQVWGDGRGCPGRGCPDGRVGKEEPQPGPKVGAWGLQWVEGSRHGAGECAPASNSAERILGEETHRPTRLLPCRDLPIGGGGGTELTVGESFGWRRVLKTLPRSSQKKPETQDMAQQGQERVPA